MKIPLQITTRNIERADALEDEIRRKAAKLDRFSAHITSCRVLIEVPHTSQHRGRLCNVRVDITVPGAEIVVTQQPTESVYLSVRDAFDSARRQLEDYERKRRGQVKQHEGAAEVSPK